MQVERVVDCRRKAATAEAPESTELEYLVKWRGLPYSECTWEPPAAIQDHGGLIAIDEWRVSIAPAPFSSVGTQQEHCSHSHQA